MTEIIIDQSILSFYESKYKNRFCKNHTKISDFSVNQYIIYKLIYINLLFQFIKFHKLIPTHLKNLLMPKLMSFIDFFNLSLKSNNFLIMSKFQFVINYFNFIKIVSKYHSDFKLYYAVKCLPDMQYLNSLKLCDGYFDCASQGEMESVLLTDAKNENIIFANPCKNKSSIIFSKNYNINLTTFDNYEELVKLYNNHPDCKLILRINVNSFAKVNLSNKFGIHYDEFINLINTKHENLKNIIGISFHIGSDNKNSLPWVIALYRVKKYIDILVKNDIHIEYIDLGGGFNMYNLELTIESIFEIHGKWLSNYKLIFEPGRALVENTVFYCPEYVKSENGNVIIDNSVLYSYFKDSALVNRSFYYLSKIHINNIVDSDFVKINNKKIEKSSLVYNKYFPDEILLFPLFGAYTVSICNEKLIKSLKIYI